MTLYSTELENMKDQRRKDSSYLYSMQYKKIRSTPAPPSRSNYNDSLKTSRLSNQFKQNAPRPRMSFTPNQIPFQNSYRKKPNTQHPRLIHIQTQNSSRKFFKRKKNKPRPRITHVQTQNPSRKIIKKKHNRSHPRVSPVQTQKPSYKSNQNKKKLSHPRITNARNTNPSRKSNQRKQNTPLPRITNVRNTNPSRISNQRKQDTPRPRITNTRNTNSSRLSNRNLMNKYPPRKTQKRIQNQLRASNLNTHYTPRMLHTRLIKDLKKLLKKKQRRKHFKKPHINKPIPSKISNRSKIIKSEQERTVGIPDDYDKSLNQPEEREISNYYQDLFASLNDIFENNDISKLKMKLNQVEEDLEISNFYRDLFTHDISNILGGISMNVELEEMKSKNDPFLSSLSRLTNRGINLISNVRKLTTSGQTEIPIESVEVLPLLDIAIRNIIEAFKDRIIEISIVSSDQDYIAWGNELLIDVFENLLHNGVKYTSIEKPIVEIEIKISKFNDGKDQFTKLEFKDHGIGISEDKKEKTFERSDGKSSKGMGIGLSLVKKIIEVLEGKIWVENRIVDDYLQGSNFVVLLKSTPIDSKISRTENNFLQEKTTY